MFLLRNLLYLQTKQRTIVTLPKLHYELKELAATGLFSNKALDYHFNYIQYRDVKKANQMIEGTTPF